MLKFFRKKNNRKKDHGSVKPSESAQSIDTTPDFVRRMRETGTGFSREELSKVTKEKEQ